MAKQRSIQSELEDEEIITEVIERGLQDEFYEDFLDTQDESLDDSAELEKIWLAFRDKECPQVLKDFIWNKHGKMI